jgi:hypothetical protein
MQSIQVNWEDEENNRLIELAVQYRLDEGSASIAGVTPKRVHFLCPNTGTALRSVGVHRPKSQSLVAQQFVSGGGLETLKERLAEKHGEIAAVQH